MQRLTKKMVRDAKQSIIRRAGDLRRMTDAEFQYEINRVNQQLGVKFDGSDRQLMSFLIVDALDRALPDFWLFKR